MRHVLPRQLALLNNNDSIYVSICGNEELLTAERQVKISKHSQNFNLIATSFAEAYYDQLIKQGGLKSITLNLVMPPKKRRTKKKKDIKKANAKKTFKRLIGIDDETFTELSKEYFLIQIRDLEARLIRYQKKCDELEISNKKYESERAQLHHENSEITAFLRRQLDHKVEEIADLQDRLLGLQQTREAEKESYETQITTLRQEIVETKEQLTSENMILSGKLASLEEFKQQKDELLEKFAEMESKLQQQELEHKDAIYNLEKKAVVDKDR